MYMYAYSDVRNALIFNPSTGTFSEAHVHHMYAYGVSTYPLGPSLKCLPGVVCLCVIAITYIRTYVCCVPMYYCQNHQYKQMLHTQY